MKKILKLLFCVILISFYLHDIVFAKNYEIKNNKKIKIKSKSYILIDYDSGKILAEKNSNIRSDPASLTKIMTSYIINQYLKLGKIHKNDLVKIKKNAWATGNKIFKGSSLMFLKPGDVVSVSQLIKGIILQSGNDACVAIADHISGNEKSFVKLMNYYAKELGMKNTHFQNSHGLTAKGQYSSAKDIVLLSRALIYNFPKEYIIYKQKSFTFNNIHQNNRNRLLWDKNFNIDGIKTGHTRIAGFNLVSSVTKNNVRLICCVLGSKNEYERDMDTKKLINLGFNFFKTIPILKKGEKITSYPILLGNKNHVNLGVNKDVYLTIPCEEDINKIKISYSIIKKIYAPIYKEQIIGKIILKRNGKIISKYPLTVLNTIKSCNIFFCIKDYIKVFFTYLFN